MFTQTDRPTGRLTDRPTGRPEPHIQSSSGIIDVQKLMIDNGERVKEFFTFVSQRETLREGLLAGVAKACLYAGFTPRNKFLFATKQLAGITLSG